jgi:hypothetical protein
MQSELPIPEYFCNTWEDFEDGMIISENGEVLVA